MSARPKIATAPAAKGKPLTLSSLVEKKALGTTVQTRVKHGGETHKVGAGEQFVKICHD